MDPVRTHDNVRFKFASIGKTRHRSVLPGFDVGAARRQPEGALGHKLGKQLLHIAAMDRRTSGAKQRPVALK